MAPRCRERAPSTTSNSAVSRFLRHGCFTPETGHWLARLARPKSAKREVGDLFDYLVGQQLERVRHGEAEGGGGLEINDQFVLERELNGQIARI